MPQASIKPYGAGTDREVTRMAEKKIAPKAPVAAKSSKEEKTAAARVTKGKHLRGKHLRGKHLR
jgi:hypothetical protein